MTRLRSGRKIVSPFKPSLNDSKERQEMTTTQSEDSFFETQYLKKWLNPKAIKCQHFRPTLRGEGVHIYVDDSNITDVQIDYSHGIIRLDGLSQNFFRTQFETYLSVDEGCLAYKLEDREERVITNGDTVIVEPMASYSLTNLMPEMAYISFTYFKE